MPSGGGAPAAHTVAGDGGERTTDHVDHAAIAGRPAVRPAVIVVCGAGATNALLTTSLIPVSAILIGIVLLGESLSARQLAGMAAIFVGIAAIDGRAGRFIAHKLRRTNP